MTSAEPTIPTVPAATVDQTLACEIDRHQRCHGTIVSLTSAHGTACGCACHGLDDSPRRPAWALHHDHSDWEE